MLLNINKDYTDNLDLNAVGNEFRNIRDYRKSKNHIFLKLIYFYSFYDAIFQVIHVESEMGMVMKVDMANHAIFLPYQCKLHCYSICMIQYMYDTV